MNQEDREIALYGANAADWLARWDDGQIVWTIEMGGLGPGYEQAIQIAMTEFLRHMLLHQYDSDKWSDEKAWQADLKDIEAHGFSDQKIDALGLSGAQWGAALGLAVKIYRYGPRWIMAQKYVEDRHIQVSRNFP